MNRKKAPTEIETQVLTLSRRRCCICFGLYRDTDKKNGQIAHLNKNRNDNRLDNLAFLCLLHHDEYDSKSSQSKNLTKNEIKQFRNDLYNQIEEIWKQPLNFFEDNNVSLCQIISGKYIRDGYNEHAEIEIMYLGNSRVRLSGFSLWGTKREQGANVGNLEFTTDLINNKLVFSEKYKDKLYRVFLEFNGREIVIKEDFITGVFGMNVSFGGFYEKVQ